MFLGSLSPFISLCLPSCGCVGGFAGLLCSSSPFVSLRLPSSPFVSRCLHSFFDVPLTVWGLRWCNLLLFAQSNLCPFRGHKLRDATSCTLQLCFPDAAALLLHPGSHVFLCNDQGRGRQDIWGLGQAKNSTHQALHNIDQRAVAGLSALALLIR